MGCAQNIESCYENQRDWSFFDVKHRTEYAYVGENPMSYVDPTGLKVRTCKRNLKGSKKMIGPAYHEYIEFDNGEVFSFAPAPGEGIRNVLSSNISESGVGAECTDWSADSSRDAAIKARALLNLTNKYHVYDYNCKDFVTDSMVGGK